ncbi:MAG: CoA transferase [Dehalococcoidia bacterium]|nr:CoA transferase [Dehalococcoidia bacterium]
MTGGPLEGIRIADFTFAWAGPYATDLLVYMGAEAIHVESNRRPDHSRMISLTTRGRFTGLDQSSVFNDMNMGKLGITLDLTKPKAVVLAKRIVKVCDVVAQNMRPGVMERLGLGYEALQEVKPDIIYLSSSARGAHGPERTYVGYAPSFAALGGISCITGYPDGAPAQMYGEIDLISATTSAFAILAALNHKQRTGEGQHIDLSSSEATSVLIGEVLMDYFMNGRVQSRSGNRDDIMAPHNCYRCKGDDKWVSIVVSSDEEWKAFCEAIGEPEWVDDDRFCDVYSRKQNEEELDRLIRQWTIGHTHHEVMDILQKVGVAAVPSYNSEELYQDPHLKERGLFTEVDHIDGGKHIVVSPPWRFSATSARIGPRAPLFGEHNQYVFGELLGMRDEEIKSLIGERVIY